MQKACTDWFVGKYIKGTNGDYRWVCAVLNDEGAKKHIGVITSERMRAGRLDRMSASLGSQRDQWLSRRGHKSVLELGILIPAETSMSYYVNNCLN